MKNFAVLDSDNMVVLILPFRSEDQLSREIYHFDKNLYSVIEYSDDGSITNNRAELFYVYDPDLNVFVKEKPDPTYIINTETYEWEPDPTLEYDINGNGCMCRYNPETKSWIPCTNAPDPEQPKQPEESDQPN